MPTPMKKILKKERENIMKILKENYSQFAEKIVPLYQLKGYEKNSNNYKVKIVKNKKVRYILFRKFLLLREKERIENILKIIDYCFSKGAKVPEIIKTDKKQLFFKHKNKFYCAFSFYHGSHFNGSLKQLREAAVGLAVLNKVLATYKTKYKFKESQYYKFLDKNSVRKVENIIKKKKRTKFDILVLKNLDKIEKLFRGTEKKIRKTILKKQLIHRDFHVMNALFSKNKLITILDFDSIIESERIRDAAFSCYRFARYAKSGKINRRIKSRTKEFVKEYNKKNKLTKTEIFLIPTLVIHEALKRISYILRRHYFYNDSTWSFDMKKHLNTIRDAKKHLTIFERKDI